MANESDPKQLSTGERVTLATLGAVVVVIATYPIGHKGYVDLFVRPDLAEWIGFALRVIGGGALGAIWGWVNRPEYDPKRAFQLGIVAPATVVGLIYANPAASVDRPVGPSAFHIETTSPISMPPGIILAAGEVTGPTTPPPPPPPRPTFGDRLIKGIFGR